MIFPRNPALPDYASNSASGFIPAIWSGKLIEKFYADTVYPNICSTAYQGEIQGMGDNIIIRTVPSITIADYQVGASLSQADYQVPVSTEVTLPINKGKAFFVRLNTVDAAQSDLDLVDIFADEASMQLAVAMDKDVLANAPLDAAATNQGTTAGVISANINLGSNAAPVQITTANAVDKILDIGQAMDEQNIPQEGRWLVLPSWYIRLLKSSDLKFAYLTGDDQSPLRNGRVGMIDRFTVYQSNNMPLIAAGTPYMNIFAGHSSGLAWASQITEVESIPNPYDFGQLMRGLCVYGYKVIEPKFVFTGRFYR